MSSTLVTVDPKIQAKPSLAEAVASINRYFQERSLSSQRRLELNWGIDESRQQLGLKLTASPTEGDVHTIAMLREIPEQDLSNPTLRDMWGIHIWGDFLEKQSHFSAERLKQLLAQTEEGEVNGN